MKETFSNYHTVHNRRKILEWGKLVALTSSGQFIIQAISFISGIIVIRQLPTHEYAFYTLANTMLGTMTILADGGISTGVMAEGGKVWLNKQKLGKVIVTGLELRKKFAIGSLGIAIPILLYFLRRHHADWTISILIVLSLVPSFLSSLSSTILEIAPKLHQDIAALQKNQVNTNIKRLGLLTLTAFVFPLSFVAILCAGLPQIWANIKLKRLSHKYADLNQDTDLKAQSNILSFVKRILPGSIYYCLSGQISLWLISSFGTTDAVAQIGALTRLSMVLILFKALFSSLLFPRYARMPNQPSLLFNRYLKIQVTLFIMTIGITGFVWLYPNEVLWILGKEYYNLKDEVILQTIASCLNLSSGIIYGLCTNRGWIIHPIISIPISFISLVSGINLFQLSTIEGVLMFNIYIASIQVILNNTYIITKISSKQQK